MTDSGPDVPRPPARRLRRLPQSPEPTQADAPRPRPGGAPWDSDRGLKMLVSNAPTRLKVVTAMRTRDASQPTPEQRAAAERDVVVVHRSWTPPT